MIDKKKVLVLLSVFIIFVLVLLMKPNEEVKSDIQDSTSKEVLSTPKTEILDIKKLENEAKDIDTNFQNIEKILENKKQTTKQGEFFNDFFTQVDTDDITTLKAKEDVKPIGGVMIKEEYISKAKEGDVIELPIFGSGTYRVQVDKKVKNPSGSTTLSGTLVENKNYSFVMTKGKERTFFTVSTPDGAYEIESKNGQGYIYSVKDIERERIDYSKPDVLIPHKEDE